MRALAIILVRASAGFATICAISAAVAAHAPLPSRALVLFGAQWCAPCRAELAQLVPIGDALGGEHRIVLAWLDRAPVIASAPRATTVTPAQATAMAEPLLAQAHGLPFAVMTDDAGAVCALVRGPVHPADIAALRTRCAPPRPGAA